MFEFFNDTLRKFLTVLIILKITKLTQRAEDRILNPRPDERKALSKNFSYCK